MNSLSLSALPKASVWLKLFNLSKTSASFKFGSPLSLSLSLLKKQSLKQSFLKRSRNLLASVGRAFALLFALTLIGCGLYSDRSNSSSGDNNVTNAVAPTITALSAGGNYARDANITLEVTAEVNDGGVLSYQWYYNAAETNIDGTLVASTQSYEVPTNTVGTFYYYVVVTNTNNSVNGVKTKSVSSSVVTITISAIPLGDYHNVSFYNADLDFVETISIARGSFELSDYNNSVSWYKANETSPTTRHTLIADINFYAAQNVQEIRTQEQLNKVRNDLGGAYILFGDIALDGAGAGFDANGWTPIGSYLNSFRGIFNGNGYKITNLWIDRQLVSDNYIGLFGYISVANIRNLGVEIDNDKGVKGFWYVGAIAGYVWNSSITNSYSAGNVIGTKQVGGIAGYVYNDSKIIASYSTGGDVNGTSDYVGGIAGIVENSSIIDSYSTADVNGSNNVGGIAGQVVDSSSIINNYSTGNINGLDNVGGITGDVNHIVADPAINNNAAINGRIEGANVGRISGRVSVGVLLDAIKNNFALSGMSVTGNTASGATGDDKTDTALKLQVTYSNDASAGGLGWKFGDDKDNPWQVSPNKNGGYPHLYWQK